MEPRSKRRSHINSQVAGKQGRTVEVFRRERHSKIDFDAIETDIVQSDEKELKIKLIIHKINQLLFNKEREEPNVSARSAPRLDKEGEGVTGFATPWTPESRQLPAFSSPLSINQKCR